MNAQTASGGVAGTLVAIGIWLFQLFHPDTKIPPEIAAAFTTVVSAIAAALSGLISSFTNH
jgi:hypothetical protein